MFAAAANADWKLLVICIVETSRVVIIVEREQQKAAGEVVMVAVTRVGMTPVGGVRAAS